MSTFSGLEIAKRALFAQQASLYTTGHNIANANTPGYSRQRVNLEATSPYPYPSVSNGGQAGQVGTGVVGSSIERLRERFLDLQYRGIYKDVGEHEARADALEKVEIIMNEPSDKGFRYVMDEFWNSWQKVSQPSAEYPTRETVIQKGKALAETFNAMDRELKELQQDFDEQIKTRAGQLDTLVKEIASLNKQIGELVPHGYVPNDLYDKRDLLVDKLSKMFDIDVETVAIDVQGKKVDGAVNIKLKQPSVDLVKGNTAADISAEPAAAPSDKLANGNTRHVLNIGGTVLDAANSPVGGEISGLMQSRDTAISSYINKIDTLANNLIKEVNAAHGKDFFSGTGARDIGVAISDPNDVANNSGEPGNNDIAKAVYALKHKSVTFTVGGNNTSTTFDEFTRSIVSTLGNETEAAQNNRENAILITKQIDMSRQSISGVNPDEEMSNMIKFQHAYNAAARTVTVIDEMLDKVINGMGVVGR